MTGQNAVEISKQVLENWSKFNKWRSANPPRLVKGWFLKKYIDYCSCVDPEFNSRSFVCEKHLKQFGLETLVKDYFTYRGYLLIDLATINPYDLPDVILKSIKVPVPNGISGDELSALIAKNFPDFSANDVILKVESWANHLNYHQGSHGAQMYLCLK